MTADLRPCATCGVSVAICRESDYAERCCHLCNHGAQSTYLGSTS